MSVGWGGGNFFVSIPIRIYVNEILNWNSEFKFKIEFKIQIQNSTSKFKIQIKDLNLSNEVIKDFARFKIGE